MIGSQNPINLADVLYVREVPDGDADLLRRVLRHDHLDEVVEVRVDQSDALVLHRVAQLVAHPVESVLHLLLVVRVSDVPEEQYK